MNAVSRRTKNKILNLRSFHAEAVLKRKIYNGWQSPKRLSVQMKGTSNTSLIQVAYCCRTWPTESNTITGINRIVKVLEIIQSRRPLGRSMTIGISLPTWTSCRRVLAKKVVESCTHIHMYLFLAEPPVIWSPASSSLENRRSPPPPATCQLMQSWRTHWLLKGGRKRQPAKWQSEMPLPAIAITGTTPFPIRLPHTQGPCWHIADRSWTANGAQKMAKHPWQDKKTLTFTFTFIYVNLVNINKNILWTCHLFVFLRAPADSSF